MGAVTEAMFLNFYCPKLCQEITAVVADDGDEAGNCGSNDGDAAKKHFSETHRDHEKSPPSDIRPELKSSVFSFGNPCSLVPDFSSPSIPSDHFAQKGMRSSDLIFPSFTPSLSSL